MKNLKASSANYLGKILLPLILLSSLFITAAIARTVPGGSLPADSTSLKAFEGTYQQKDNQYMYVKLVVINDSLVVKEAEGDKQIKLNRKSDLAFEMPDDDGDEMISVAFSKNDAGEVTQALLGGRQLWIKVKGIVPITEVKLSADQLKAFEGKYQFEEKKDTFLQITATPDGLSLKQLWDGREIAFIAIGGDTF